MIYGVNRAIYGIDLASYGANAVADGMNGVNDAVGRVRKRKNDDYAAGGVETLQPSLIMVIKQMLCLFVARQVASGGTFGFCFPLRRGFGNDFRRQLRAGWRLVPVQRFEIIANELLVEARLALAGLVLIGGPE